MTDKEITERLKTLPYEVPADISPGAISTMMAVGEFATGATPQEVEEKFWQKLEQASPEEREEFFTAARQTRNQLSTTGLITMACVLLAIVFWLLS